MKEYYNRIGIPTARYCMAETEEKCLEFIRNVGWPVVVKPDNGVGASHTYRLENEWQLADFFRTKEPDIPYIMEEYVCAEVNSYDAVIDSRGEPLFETGNVTPVSIMDIVNNEDNSIFYILKNLPGDTRQAGRATVKSFGVRSRFVHFEFFRLLKDQEGLGRKGDLVGLEVNMRPCGGFTPDMMDFAGTTDVYKIWADMIAYDRTDIRPGERNYCAFAGRRDNKDFVMSHEDIMKKYGDRIKMSDRLPEVLAAAMGNQIYIGVFGARKEMDEFYKDVLKCQT